MLRPYNQVAVPAERYAWVVDANNNKAPELCQIRGPIRNTGGRADGLRWVHSLAARTHRGSGSRGRDRSLVCLLVLLVSSLLLDVLLRRFQLFFGRFFTHGKDTPSRWPLHPHGFSLWRRSFFRNAARFYQLQPSVYAYILGSSQPGVKAADIPTSLWTHSRLSGMLWSWTLRL